MRAERLACGERRPAVEAPTASTWTARPKHRRLLSTLALRFGVPFVVLASTSVVAQQWLAHSKLDERDDPYGLYASSNAGSLLALLVYVFAWEPSVGLREQAWLWTAGYCVYLVAA